MSSGRQTSSYRPRTFVPHSIVQAKRPSCRVTGTPSQREYTAGSVKAANVASWLVSTSVLATTTGVVGAQAAERVPAGAVAARGADRGALGQARLAQDGQVLGDGRLGHRERRGDLPRRQLTVPDQAQDLAPDR